MRKIKESYDYIINYYEINLLICISCIRFYEVNYLNSHFYTEKQNIIGRIYAWRLNIFCSYYNYNNIDRIDL